MEQKRLLANLSFVALGVALAAGGAWAAQPKGRPVAVSPGDASKLVLTGDRCPTFSWGAVPGTESYELIVYRLGEGYEEERPVITQTVAGSASSWTPSLDRCLERGGQYAWSVRALANEGTSEWSVLSLFQVPSGQSGEESEEALTVPRRYLDTGAAGSGETANRRQLSTRTGAAASVNLSTPQATEYVDAFCQQVVGTLNLHWLAVAGPFVPCEGIEFTDGTLADASDGTIMMSGTSVTPGTCLGLDSYTLTVSADGLTLTGEAHALSVPLTLTRTSAEDCFVGHWVFGADDLLLHIAAEPFPGPSETQLVVDGGVEAGSFKGDGSGLTHLDPTKLSAGTAEIDVTGTAANVTGTVALANGGTGATDEAGARANLGAAAATDLASHSENAAAHTDSTCDGAACDGTNFINLNASNLTTGTVAEARIADQIARDAEVASLILGEASCPGAAASTNRYADCGNGTVRDNNTGLIWLKDATCGELDGLDAAEKANWHTAQSAAAALASGKCGLTDGSVAGDWRQPTISELCSAWQGSVLQPCPAGAATDSLMNTSVGPPTVADTQGDGAWSEGNAFIGVPSSAVWSSTDDGGNAWFANLVSGSVEPFSKFGTTHVWPVRTARNLSTGIVAEPLIADEIARDSEVKALIAAEASCPGSVGSTDRYTDCGNGTVRDNNTGLFWLRDASCADLPGQDENETFFWVFAETAAAGLASGTCDLTDGSQAGDWRQATVSEFCSAWQGSVLQPCPAGAAPDSLMDTSVGSPFVVNGKGDGVWSEGDLFVGVHSLPYWTSTDDGGSAWFVNLSSGSVEPFSQSGRARIWPVRGQLPAGSGAGDTFPDVYTKTELQTAGSAQVHWSNLTNVPANLADTTSGDAMAGEIASGKKAWVDGTEVTGNWFRFQDNGDGTVTDHDSKLMWLKDASCMGTGPWESAASTPGTVQTKVVDFNNGTGAFACAEYAAGTYSDWRVPEIWELVSVTDKRYSLPALSNATGNAQWASGDAFVGVLFTPYWSGTWTRQVFASGETLAWAITFDSVFVASSGVTNTWHLWPVRDAP